MASSYFTESEAPRDFRVSSVDSDGHYTKCLLCYTVKRNFYCTECVRNGCFAQSSMPYSDRFSEKQIKLLRLKSNRKHVLDRCEKLLAHKLKKDILLTEAKQSRDQLDLLRLAIEQRRNNIEEKKRQLAEIKQHNNELGQKIPRYQKRVSSLAKHVQLQAMELQNKVIAYDDQTQALVNLQHSRIRQLTKYIFPVYITYESSDRFSDSIEDLEFVGEDAEELPRRRSQLHIVAPWLYTDGDLSEVESWCTTFHTSAEQCKEVVEPALDAAHRSGAALGLAAQLVALLAWLLDVRLPHPLSLSEQYKWQWSASGLWWRARCVCACVGAVCARCGVLPGAARSPLHALHSLHALATVAAAPPAASHTHRRSREWADEVEEAWAAAGCGADIEPPDDEPPEHLSWPDNVHPEEVSSSPPPAVSLVTSAAASLASMWRVFTK